MFLKCNTCFELKFIKIIKMIENERPMCHMRFTGKSQTWILDASALVGRINLGLFRRYSNTPPVAGQSCRLGAGYSVTPS